MKKFLRLLILFFAFHMIFTVALAQHATYAKVRVSNGPLLEYPAHWKIADEATVQNRNHATQAVAEIAGVDLSGFQKNNRVIIESQPSPSTAQVRASIVTPQDYTEGDLRKVTINDLQGLKEEFEVAFLKMSKSGAVKLHKMGEPRIERIAEKLALVISYTRYSVTDTALWQVEQIKIPFEDRMLSLTISYRASDTVTMKPIVDRVKRTLTF